jgi:hypothetical protein
MRREDDARRADPNRAAAARCAAALKVRAMHRPREAARSATPPPARPAVLVLPPVDGSGSRSPGASGMLGSDRSSAWRSDGSEVERRAQLHNIHYCAWLDHGPAHSAEHLTSRVGAGRLSFRPTSRSYSSVTATEWRGAGLGETRVSRSAPAAGSRPGYRAVPGGQRKLAGPSRRGGSRLHESSGYRP